VVELPPADVVVAGGGPVACALALALSESQVSVTRIADGSESADRPIALSHGSRLILERLGAWRSIPNTPIETIHVSQQGFGRTVMRCTEHALPALGYVTAYSDIVTQLSARSPAVGASLAHWETDATGVTVKLSRSEEARSIRARVLVLADGGKVHRAEHERSYGQHAIVAEVTAERPRRGIAWERFTPEGPLALLPYGERYALIWGMGPARARSLLDCEDRIFLDRLRHAFGGRLGEFLMAGRRAVFPLALRHGAVNPEPRTLAIGNAAQTLHPVAGQGLNLGLRDAWELARMLLDPTEGEIGSPEFLARYVRRRRFDRYASIGFTDFLVRIFSNSLAPLSVIRGAGLSGLDALPAARGFLARRMIFGARALP